MKTKIISILLIMSSALMLMACGDEIIPDLDEEQTALITEYAADLLLKYDSTSTSRLLPQGAGDTHVVLPDHSQDIVIPSADKITQTEDEPLVGEDDVTVNNIEGSKDTSEKNRTDGFESFVSADGISIEYAGLYEVVDSYPTEGDNAYFTVDATEGHKLLVLHFNIKATSDVETQIDMNKYALRYRVAVNGGSNTHVLSTMLINDILSYKGTVEAGATDDIVAIAEIAEEEASNITSIVFTIRGKESSAVMNLK